MKKILVSVCFIFGFAINAFYQRSVDAGSLSIGKDTSALVTTQDTPAVRASEGSTETNSENEVEADEVTAVLPVKTTPTPVVKPDPVVVIPKPKPEPTPVPTPIIPQGKFRNGTYTGSAVDASYGTVQVEAIITNGKLSDVKFLSYPNDRQHSVQVSNYSMPILKQEAISAQSANVDAVSGASYTSAAFVESLGVALAKA